ncbi:MAG: TolC family protein [Opitutaceae bacterium]|nr:TolC family protein [Opitutaceae bacterium]
MRKLSHLLFLGTCWLTAGLRAEAPINLTLAEALATAERTSLQVLVGRETVNQAVEAALQQRSNLLPQVTLDATQRRSRTASVGGALVSSGINNRFDAQLNGRLDLLNPQRIATYKAATYAEAVARLGEEQTREIVLATVATTYFTHLRNLRRTEVLDANITRANSLLQLARNQLNAGVATQIDVTRAEAQLAIDEQARLQQDTLLQSSELQLKQLLAFDLGRPLQLAEFNVRRREPSAYTASLEEAAFGLRADLRGARKLLEQNELEVRAARFSRLPSFALIGSYGYATAEAFDNNETNVWSGSVALSLPVFDSARSRALTNIALSRRRAQELRLQNLETEISAELRLARQDAASRLAQINVAEKGFRLAQEELTLAGRRFEQGVADNRELIEAQNRLAAASDNLIEAGYRYNLSRLELARATGRVRAILDEQAE